MAQWLEHWTFKRDKPDSNPLSVVSKLGQFRSTRCISCTNKYLTIDNGAVIVARLNVSQRRRVGVEWIGLSGGER